MIDNVQSTKGLREYIQLAIRQAGLKQYEVARRLNMADANFSRLINGHREFPLALAASLADILGCDKDELMTLVHLHNTANPHTLSQRVNILEDRLRELEELTLALR